jgi:probable HAF family extracellular repeat protein
MRLNPFVCFLQASLLAVSLSCSGDVLEPPSFVTTLEIFVRASAASKDWLEVGDELSLSVSMTDSRGQVVRGTRVSWFSSNDQVATVDENGLVTATGVGKSVAISAAASGVKAVKTFKVRPKIVDLGVYHAVFPRAINASGQIGGAVILQPDGRSYAFRVALGEVPALFPEYANPSFPSTIGAAIDGAGNVAGSARMGTDRYGETHPVRWVNGTMEDLGLLPGQEIYDPGDPYGSARGANHAGAIVGISAFGDESYPFLRFQRGFVWRPGVGMERLETLGGNDATAEAINDLGDIVGGSNTSAGITHAYVRWANSATPVDLGTLGGLVSVAQSISLNRYVVGWSQKDQTDDSHAFLWQTGVGMRDLGTLSGGGTSSARGVNSLGQVVGEASAGSGLSHAFLWTEGEGMQDLGSPFGGPSAAYAINESGLIVGKSGPEGAEHIVVWVTRHKKEKK